MTSTLASFLAATHLPRTDCTVIIAPQVETPVEREQRRFEERQQCITPAISPTDRAMEEFRERQRRLRCSAHPKEC